jgi:bacteriocin-like protein
MKMAKIAKSDKPSKTPSSPDKPVKTVKKEAIELTADELKRISGGALSRKNG